MEEEQLQKSVLITGGGGYLGYHIGLQLAARGFRVCLFDLRPPMPAWRHGFVQQHEHEHEHGPDSERQDYESALSRIAFVQGDICDFKAVRSAVVECGATGIIHSASLGMSGSENLPAYDDLTEKVNLHGSRSVLRAARAVGPEGSSRVRALVFTSTVNVVFNGDRRIHGRDERSLDYLDLGQHKDHYSRTKQVAEELILTASGSRQKEGDAVLHTCALRLNGMYGPCEQRHLPRMVEVIRSGSVRFTYNRHSRQDFTHIDNAVQAHVKALEALLDRDQCHVLSGEAYFITDGQAFNNLEFFLGPLLPAFRPQDPDIPARSVPFWLVLAVGWLMVLLSRLLGRRFSLPIWAITPTEAYKSGVTHYFDVGKARRDFGYSPSSSGWDAAAWAETVHWLKHSHVHEDGGGDHDSSASREDKKHA